jgi:hypothetical protein
MFVCVIPMFVLFEEVEPLRRADPISKESYRLSLKFIVLKFILKWEKAIRPNKSKEEGGNSCSYDLRRTPRIY